jgi:hypothetical protein
MDSHHWENDFFGWLISKDRPWTLYARGDFFWHGHLTLIGEGLHRQQCLPHWKD